VPYPLPRAVHIDHEMMRIFRSVGLADAVLPLMREAHGHIHIGADGAVIRYLGSAGLPKRFGWANDYFFFQPELEAAMQAGLARYPHVELRRGVTVAALAQTSAGVALTTQCADGERRVAARTVVACDGANSFVRKTLGIPLADMQFHEPWLVVDAEVDGPISFPDFTGVPQGADLQHLCHAVRSEATRNARPRAAQSPPLGIHAAAGRGRQRHDAKRARCGARRALCAG
jgi:3-(3-hydroxy-phenyl)propionate hydroxylase